MLGRQQGESSLTLDLQSRGGHSALPVSSLLPKRPRAARQLWKINEKLAGRSWENQWFYFTRRALVLFLLFFRPLPKWTKLSYVYSPIPIPSESGLNAAGAVIASKVSNKSKSLHTQRSSSSSAKGSLLSLNVPNGSWPDRERGNRERGREEAAGAIRSRRWGKYWFKESCLSFVDHFDRPVIAQHYGNDHFLFPSSPFPACITTNLTVLLLRWLTKHQHTTAPLTQTA